MTLHTIFQHLRKNNPGEYRLFLGCNTFAILLISSFLAVLTSPLVQSVLPEGGDSRKQVYIIFAAALLGCFLFTIYSSSLFLRYKSRETGILTAMGFPGKPICAHCHGSFFPSLPCAPSAELPPDSFCPLSSGSVFSRW